MSLLTVRMYALLFRLIVLAISKLVNFSVMTRLLLDIIIVVLIKLMLKCGVIVDLIELC